LDTRELTRKLIRWSALGISVLVVTVALASFGLHTYGVHRLEEARKDFFTRWEHLAQYTPPPSVPDNENGARWLVAGGRAIVCSVEDRKFYGQLSGRSATGWTNAEASRARWILHEQQNALEILVRSGTFEIFNLGTDGNHATYETVDFSSIVMGIRLLVLETRLAWSEGRTTDALAALNAVGRSADGLLQTPIVMMSTIGSAAERWAVGAAAAIVSDPCTIDPTLEILRAALPSEDPVQRGNITLAVSIAEIAEEGLQFIDDFHDPSMGWSIPLWVSNHYLLEDLFVAEILDRWSHYLEVGQTPAAHWPPDAADSIWGDSSWPPWLAMAGTYTPNLLRAKALGQAASTELQQLQIALGLRLASPEGLGQDACELIAEQAPTALTGGPVTCRFDDIRGVIVIEVPGAERVLSAFVAPDNQASQLLPIELPVDVGDADCR